MSEKSPQTSAPEDRIIVNDTADVIGRMMEENTIRQWVNIENPDSLDSFQEYMNSRPDGKRTYHTTFEVARDTDPLKTELFTGDVFKSDASDAEYTINGKREIGDKSVYRIAKLYKDRDGNTKKAVFELPEEGAKAYLSENGATLLNDIENESAAKGTSEVADITSATGTSTKEVKTDTTIGSNTEMPKSETVEEKDIEEKAEVNSEGSSASDKEARRLKKVFERTYMFTAEDVKNLIDAAKVSADTGPIDPTELTTSATTETSDKSQGPEHRIVGVTQNADEIRAMVEVATARHASNQEQLANLQERIQNASNKNSEEKTPVTSNSADRLARLQARLNKTDTSTSQVTPNTIPSSSEKSAKKRTMRGFFSSVRSKISSLFKNRSNVQAESLSHDEQVERDNKANWSTIAQAEASTGELFTAEIAERKSKKPNIVKERLRKLGKGAYRFLTWNADAPKYGPRPATVSQLNTRRKSTDTMSSDRRAA